MTKCDKCNGKAIIYQKYSGMHLCIGHFESDAHRKIRESIRQTGIFARSARVAVAVSGCNGCNNSLVMIYALKKLFSHRKDIDFVAILIDEGIKHYLEERLYYARELAERLEIPYIIKRFRDAFGRTLDELTLQVPPSTSCIYCEAMRKVLLYRTAKEIDADALATGHSLDDEAEAIFLNYLKGDIRRLILLRSRKMPGLVPEIKPLGRIPEKEIRLYSITHDLFKPKTEYISCPHMEVLRHEVKHKLNNFDLRHPGTKYSLLRSQERLMELQKNFPFHQCDSCGELRIGSVCSNCILIGEVCNMGAKPLNADAK